MHTTSASGVLVYVGTYSQRGSEGIYVFSFDPDSGRLIRRQTVPAHPNPAYLAVHPNRRFLYSVHAVREFHGVEGGGLSAFAIEPDGGLTWLNQTSALSPAPAHAAVDHTGRCLLVANYQGGSVTAVPIREDGSLRERGVCYPRVDSEGFPLSQPRSKMHAIVPAPDNRYALATDLGRDQVLVFRLDPDRATLSPSEPPAVNVAPGRGPRHLAFHPNGRFLYAINERGSSVTVFSYEGGSGLLEEIETVSTIPVGFNQTNYCADIKVHPSGRFLYGSNRGHDSIAVYRIDPETGRLTLVEIAPARGKDPRDLCVDPSGAYLLCANQSSDNVVTFRIDDSTGALEATGRVTEVPSPVCIVFATAHS